MKIDVTSIFVDDQDKALAFYTDVLGFVKKTDIPAGEYKWLTVVSPEDPKGIELLLEPNVHHAAETYQQELYHDDIPAIAFTVNDLQKTYHALSDQGVVFTTPPSSGGPVTYAVLDDTCGNLIQITEKREAD